VAEASAEALGREPPAGVSDPKSVRVAGRGRPPPGGPGTGAGESGKGGRGQDSPRPYRRVARRTPTRCHLPPLAGGSGSLPAVAGLRAP